MPDIRKPTGPLTRFQNSRRLWRRLVVAVLVGMPTIYVASVPVVVLAIQRDDFPGLHYALWGYLDPWTDVGELCPDPLGRWMASYEAILLN